MNSSTHYVTVNDIEVQVVRKNIKSLRLSVNPPDGSVRMSVPRFASDDNVRMMVIANLHWIKKQQAHFEALPKKPQTQALSGESYSLFGQGYILDVVERPGRHEVAVQNNAILRLRVKPGTSSLKRGSVLNEWYRAELKARIPTLIEKWQPIIGREVADWGVKKMKTRWGSCNINQRRIWLNLELAKKPVECLEYVLVHEMVHLRERYHNANFYAYMDRFLPQWRLHRDTLNQMSAVHGALACD